MSRIRRLTTGATFLAVLLTGVLHGAQQGILPEEFTAVAVANDEFGSGAGTILIRITRWSTDAESARLVETLRQKGSKAMLEELKDARSVGTIRTPDSLAYDLRYAHQTKDEEGGRQIVIATDRPIGFWEASKRPRTIDYPFVVAQMQMGADGKGKGTLSYGSSLR
jgi:hypothetical protein